MSPTTPLEAHAQGDAIATSMLEEGLQDIRMKMGPDVEVEYGRRADDGALVFHIFPPGYARSMNDETVVATWPRWRAARDAIEAALLKHFSPERLRADYVEELSSFCIIVSPLPPAADLMALVERFLADLEAELRTASETRP